MSPLNPPLDDVLSADDQQRLSRLIERTLGRGFKMAVVEVANRLALHAILDWIRPQVEALGGAVRTIDVAQLLDRPTETLNVWAALREIYPDKTSLDPKTVLTLWNLDERTYSGEEGRSDLIQQFNVQRDLFVRDFPCFWLLFVHPASRQRWWKVAPDFTDFVAVWAEAPVSTVEVPEAPRREEVIRSPVPSLFFDGVDWPPTLIAAWEALSLSRYDEALDLIQTYRIDRSKGPITERGLAIAARMEAQIQAVRGDPSGALRRLREEILPLFESLGDERERAETFGVIADLLTSQGDLDEALRIRREEELPVYERLGDVRVRAITLEQIADVLASRGQVDEALRIYREQALPIHERLGGVRDRAITMGRIADVLQARGQTDEALKIRREEELPVYERLGDVLGRAITLGQIADVLQARGKTDEARAIWRDECLPVLRRLDEPRLVSLVLGRLGISHFESGDRDVAIRYFEEALPFAERSDHPATLGWVQEWLEIARRS